MREQEEVANRGPGKCSQCRYPMAQPGICGRCRAYQARYAIWPALDPRWQARYDEEEEEQGSEGE